jgi:hypothetical protein
MPSERLCAEDQMGLSAQNPLPVQMCRVFLEVSRDLFRCPKYFVPSMALLLHRSRRNVDMSSASIVRTGASVLVGGAAAGQEDASLGTGRGMQVLHMRRKLVVSKPGNGLV